MATVLEVLVVLAGAGAAARLAVGFSRWSRAQPGPPRKGFGLYLRESLGDWVDRVGASKPWFPYEGTSEKTGTDHPSNLVE